MAQCNSVRLAKGTAKCSNPFRASCLPSCPASASALGVGLCEIFLQQITKQTVTSCRSHHITSNEMGQWREERGRPVAPKCCTESCQRHIMEAGVNQPLPRSPITAAATLGRACSRIHPRKASLIGPRRGPHRPSVGWVILAQDSIQGPNDCKHQVDSLDR